MIFKLGATIPTVQYGNLMPEIEVEAPTQEEAQAIALPQMQRIWNTVCQDGSQLRLRDIGGSGASAPVANPGKVMVCDFSGEQLTISDDHTYTDTSGNVFQSGSRFAEQFGYPFPKETVLPLYAKKFDVEPKVIDDFWNDKGDFSRMWGDAVHKAMELYGKHTELVEKLSTEEKPVVLGIHPIILPQVEDFFADRMEEKAMYEVFVVDKSGKRCGQIDRLVITGDKTCIIEDYKTNTDLEKQGTPKYLKAPFGGTDTTPLLNQPMSLYTIQLNFYRGIMESLGWTVKGMRIQHLEEGWTTIDVPRIELP